MSRDDGRDRHEQAETEREADVPDADADGDGRQSVGAEPPRHYGVRKLHAGDGQKIHDQRPRQYQ